MSLAQISRRSCQASLTSPIKDLRAAATALARSRRSRLVQSRKASLQAPPTWPSRATITRSTSTTTMRCRRTQAGCPRLKFILRPSSSRCLRCAEPGPGPGLKRILFLQRLCSSSSPCLKIKKLPRKWERKSEVPRPRECLSMSTSRWRKSRSSRISSRTKVTR